LELYEGIASLWEWARAAKKEEVAKDGRDFFDSFVASLPKCSIREVLQRRFVVVTAAAQLSAFVANDAVQIDSESAKA